MAIVLFITGLIFLIGGAEVLVRGASRLAAAIGIPPLIIGLTVVAFGTSSPELAVSIKAASSNQASIALGNVVGSNIFNVLFILGLSALVTPLIVSQQLVRLDVPLMIVVSFFVLFLVSDAKIGRIDGLFLTTSLLAYITFLIYKSRKSDVITRQQEEEKIKKKRKRWIKDTAFVIGGLLLLVIGSRWLVDSAVAISKYFGVSELIIGLTVVAAGTSLPEVVTSVIASLRGERDIAVGNVVGSNLFNIMGVLGLSGIVAPNGLAVSSGVIRFDIPIMIVVAFACLPIFFTGGRISRWEGAVLLLYYIAYTIYLIFAASYHDILTRFSAAMLYFAIPLTLVTLITLAMREIRRK